jgi:hypothetical protein
MPYYLVIEPFGQQAGDAFAVFISTLSNGRPWMETCKVDNIAGMRMSTAAWFDFSSSANDGSERPKPDYVPPPGLLLPNALLEWSAATFSYDGTAHKLPLSVSVQVDPALGLACRIGMDDLENHFDEHILFDTTSTRYIVLIAKRHLRCVPR